VESAVGAFAALAGIGTLAVARYRVALVKVWIAHESGLPLLGEVPAGVTIEVLSAPDQLPSDPAEVEFWTPPFLSQSDVLRLVGGVAERSEVQVARQAGIAERGGGMTGLRVVQLMSAGAEAWVGHLPADVTLCDARGVHDSSTSEWVLTAVLSYLRDFPLFARAQFERRWAYKFTDELAGKRILIVGAGSIGAAVAARLAPFEVSLTRVARTARDGVHGVEELPSLLPNADVVVLLLPLTEATTGLVDAKFLAAMPDGSLLVNAARGPIVDTDALTGEAVSGRIGVAMDVTSPEPLPADHALWTLPNVLITPHVGGSVHGFLPRAYALVGRQLRRYVAGEPLDNVVIDGY
jgi:phosphoglycerate dehydrogenase-like enzyme